MTLTCAPFTALDTQTLFTIMRGRVDVFVVEQMCPYPELDEQDIAASTLHLYSVQNNQLLTYARCYEKNSEYSAIGRVLVNKSERGKGLAPNLLNTAIACCKSQWPDRDIYIGAQTYLVNFYRNLGFEPVNAEYLEDGIAHQDMILRVAIKPNRVMK